MPGSFSARTPSSRSHTSRRLLALFHVDRWPLRVRNSDWKRRPKLRIELPGNPILGGGKSDNQNHTIFFYRGKYLQLVDANKDNYLEECLKIRDVLDEFEE